MAKKFLKTEPQNSRSRRTGDNKHVRLKDQAQAKLFKTLFGVGILALLKTSVHSQTITHLPGAGFTFSGSILALQARDYHSDFYYLTAGSPAIRNQPFLPGDGTSLSTAVVNN